MKAFRLYLIAIVLLCFTKVNGQFLVSSGTSLTIDSATIVDFSLVNGNLTIDSSAQIINNGIIQLGDSISIIEPIGFPIKGQGFERHESSITGSISDYSIGNTGLKIWGISASGLSIDRYHDSIADPSGTYSVNRYFKINTTDLTIDSVQLTADTTELFGTTRNQLFVLSQSNGQFTNHGKDFLHPYTGATVVKDSIQYLSLFPYELNLIFNDSLTCSNDSAIGIIAENGFGNNGYYVLEISDSSGNFIGNYLDTVYSSVDTFHFYLPQVLSGHSDFIIRIINASNQVVSDYGITDVFSYPIISGLADSVFCTSDSMVSLAISPSNGYFSGSFVDSIGNFNAFLSGGGIFPITYSVNNVAGCESVSNPQVYVYTDPVITTISNSANIMTANDTAASYQWYFNGTPLTGETSQSHTGLNNGLYVVELINDAGCSTFSDTFNLLYHTINTIGLENTISVFPNPANDYVTINAIHRIESISLSELSGKLIYSIPVNAAHFITHPINQFENGVYILTVRTLDGETMNTKLVIRR